MRGARRNEPHLVGMTQYLGDLPLFTRGHYVHEMKADFPASAFSRATSRLGFIPVYGGIAALAIVAIARHWAPWFAVPVLPLVIGAAFAGLTFVGHELLHGAIIGGARARSQSASCRSSSPTCCRSRSPTRS